MVNTASARGEESVMEKELYELRLYRVDTAEKAEVMDGFFRTAAIPALNRLGVKPGISEIIESLVHRDIVPEFNEGKGAANRIGLFRQLLTELPADFMVALQKPFHAAEPGDKLAGRLGADTGQAGDVV